MPIAAVANARRLRPPPWFRRPRPRTRRRGGARSPAAIYGDLSQTEWVHLLDGGIADNLALRGLLSLFISLQSNAELFNRTALGTRRVLVISIDGEAEAPHEL